MPNAERPREVAPSEASNCILGAALSFYRQPPASAPHEPSAWLRQRIADRVAAVRERGLDPHRADPLIVVPLGRTGAPGSREDRTCDRCRTYVPDGELFYPTQVHALPGLLLFGGLCKLCADVECGELL